MRRRITLYIAGRKVDLSDDALVLMNYTFEDLANPTVVKNSYSKTITLPGTPNNNEVFGNIWKLDRVTPLTAPPSAGVNFNATWKTPFQIYGDLSEVIVSGYCKLDGIERTGAEVKYKLSLYGGLGTFLYNLSYNEDGSKRTLANLIYRDIENKEVAGSAVQLWLGSAVVTSAWDYIRDPDGFIPQDRTDLFYNIINFAPCYNGYPKDFDANRAIVDNDTTFFSLPKEYEFEGVTYGAKKGTTSFLLSFGSNHTEWEMNDLRWYLQRPVISLLEVLRACADAKNNGGYAVDIAPEFLASRKVADIWMTLPMIPTKSRNDPKWASSILGATMSPADYLLAFCKMFGMVILCDNAEKRISIKPRKEFFGGDVIDMTQRIDTSTISITPNVAVHRYYQMGGAKHLVGEWAKSYSRDFGREYGIQRINTGYEFDRETEILTKGSAFAEAADVAETSKGFFTLGARKNPLPDFPSVNEIPQIYYDTVESEYWGMKDGEETSRKEPVGHYFNLAKNQDVPGKPYTDWLPKVQLHDEDNKEGKGENILLYYTGMKRCPTFQNEFGYQQTKKYFVTSDDRDMATLNNGKACWRIIDPLTTKYRAIEELPSFRRDLLDAKGVVTNTLLYGEPLARGTFDATNPNHRSVYGDCWKAYLTDRYDVDAKVMRCKANLRGMQVSQELLGRFFYYGGGIWVLNKIEDYSLTTDDLTKCEFIKVREIQNYTK